MKNLIKKIIENPNVGLEDAVRFISHVYPIMYPKRTYREDLTVKALNHPRWGAGLLQFFIDEVLTNPSKYNLEIMTITDLSTKQVLKQIIS